jgi:hypothetical protein
VQRTSWSFSQSGILPLVILLAHAAFIREPFGRVDQGLFELTYVEEGDLYAEICYIGVVGLVWESHLLSPMVLGLNRL